MMVVMVVVVVEGVMGVMAVTAITTPVIATLMMRPKMRQPAVWMSLHGGGDDLSDAEQGSPDRGR